ncbi:MAG: RsmB/NOP family class I SAM-dependent RNA methyltransferase [Flammeovirgaceae bacterium]|nr:RsmB/NOP family class I SAM-dependent RNA methyltransferase [Flammeovirgaceae bacterium]
MKRTTRRKKVEEGRHPSTPLRVTINTGQTERSRSLTDTKLHRSTVEAVIRSLQKIFIEKRYADKVIEKTLKENPRWGSRDRRFIAETTYEIVRWYRLLKESAEARNNDFITLFGAWCIWKNIELPTWYEIKSYQIQKVKEQLEKNQSTRKIKESIPDWLDEVGEIELKEKWDQELSALNKTAAVVLRANTLKVSLQKLQTILSEQGVETYAIQNFPDALILQQRQNVFLTAAFKEGLFEVQDAGSQTIAPFLRIEPGMRIIDACAGGGGKTLHIASLLQNKGRIISMDVEAWKLDELKNRAKRAGATTIETRVIDSSKVIKRLEHSADRLLLDVPCSGLGVLKRNPDAKWKMQPDFIDKIKITQQEILQSYSQMLKPGGLMVYATCSILYSENEDQVRKFLSGNSSFELIEEKRLWPSDGFDGFYMALIKRLAV